MRIHRLEITGVGPFRDRQVIDFDPLNEAGLFLIDGPTGVGKTTIIDALCYALYGEMSGGSSSDLARIRSNFCADDDPTGVLCEFSVDGRRHVVSRVPKGVRDPQEPERKAKSAPARQVLRELASDGSEVRVLTKDDEIRHHISSILRMSDEQFRRLVVLPQGQFAELLRMRPKERLEALGSLLGQEFFQRLQQDLKARGDEADRLQKEAKDAVREAADRLAGRLSIYLQADARTGGPDSSESTEGTLLDETPAFTDDRLADEQRLALVEGLLQDLVQQSADATAARARAQEAMRAADTAAKAAESLAQALADIGDAQQEVARARARLHPADTDVVTMADADLASRIDGLNVLAGSLGEHAEWEQAADERAEARERQAADLEQERRAAEAIAEQRAQLPKRRAEAERRRASAQVAAALLAPARTEQQRLAEQLAKARELDLLRPRLEAASDDLERAAAAKQSATADETRARGEQLQLLTAQLDQQAAYLAATLDDGRPCPVCGSAEHPSPAAPPAGAAAVTEEGIALADAAVESAADAVRLASETVAEAQQAKEALGSLVSALSGAVGSATVLELEPALARADAEVAAAEQAAQTLDSLDDELRTLQAAEADLEKQLGEHRARATTIEAEISKDDQANAERERRIREVIGDADSATALLAATKERLTALRALVTAQSALATAAAAVPAEQRTTPLEVAQEQARALRLQFDEALRLHAAQVEVAESLRGAVDESRPLVDAFTAALTTSGQVMEQTADAIFLAGLVTAQSGANARKLPLYSYALQRKFEAVLQAASVHLERISAGRFIFEMSEDAAGAGHSGLGISVFDSWSGARQDPKALSGGETFYASLSLALGLADIVRDEAGGSALETLFVDEGFGSLDQDTLYQVLDQLDKLRVGGRVVGVISHVTEMKEQIPERIEVRRKPGQPSRIISSETDLT